MNEPKQFLKPDLHAPRSRDKLLDFLAYPDKDPIGFFSRLKQQYPQLDKYSNRQIASWIIEFNKNMAQEVVEDRNGVKLPGRLGKVVPGLCKLSARKARYNIDFKSSEQLGVIVPYQNLHTNGYTAKIFYVSNISWCRFKPCRALSRAVSSVMKSEGGYAKYIIFSKRQHVVDLFRKPKISRISSKEIREAEAKKKSLADYDEFRME